MYFCIPHSTRVDRSTTRLSESFPSFLCLSISDSLINELLHIIIDPSIHNIHIHISYVYCPYVVSQLSHTNNNNNSHNPKNKMPPPSTPTTTIPIQIPSSHPAALSHSHQSTIHPPRRLLIFQETRNPQNHAEIVYLPVNKQGLPITGPGPELPSILELPLRILRAFTEIFNLPKYSGWYASPNLFMEIDDDN